MHSDICLFYKNQQNTQHFPFSFNDMKISIIFMSLLKREPKICRKPWSSSMWLRCFVECFVNVSSIAIAEKDRRRGQDDLLDFSSRMFFSKHLKNDSRHLTHYLIYKHEKIIFLPSLWYFLVYDSRYEFSFPQSFVCVLFTHFSFRDLRAMILCLHVCLSRGIVSQSNEKQHPVSTRETYFCIQQNKHEHHVCCFSLKWFIKDERSSTHDQFSFDDQRDKLEMRCFQHGNWIRLNDSEKEKRKLVKYFNLP